jgi:hypothetical protein
MQMNRVLPLMGAAVLGMLALVAAAILLRRRRRRREELDENATYEEAEYGAEPEPMIAEPLPEPAIAAAPVAAAAMAGPVHDPIPNDRQGTGLPRGFDLSRFGPHVQAAYRGPTPDNPSSSLKHRIRQAGAMDRAAGTYRCEPARTEPAEAEDAPQASAEFMLGHGDGTMTPVRRAPTKNEPA